MKGAEMLLLFLRTLANHSIAIPLPIVLSDPHEQWFLGGWELMKSNLVNKRREPWEK
jgi:hypothetical protein